MSVKRHVAGLIAGLAVIAIVFGTVGAVGLLVQDHALAFEGAFLGIMVLVAGWLLGIAFALDLVEHVTGWDIR